VADKEEEPRMAFDDIEAELGLLLTRMINEPQDRHELYFQIRQRLSEMKAYGAPLPADLVQFEQDLEAEFAADQEDAVRRERLYSALKRRGRR
jgi:hypothetical protein